MLIYVQNVFNNRFINKMNFHVYTWTLLSGRMCYLNLLVGRNKLSKVEIVNWGWNEVIFN